jgi:hypothetical protein
MALTKIGSSGITANALTSLAIANGSIQAVDLADGAVTNDKLAGSITSGKITSVANTAITGNIISSQITSVANTQITGLVMLEQLLELVLPICLRQILILVMAMAAQQEATQAAVEMPVHPVLQLLNGNP